MTSKKNHPGINNGRWKKWLRQSEFTPAQIELARGVLMTGPRAQPPTWRAIRKTLARFRRGDFVHGKNTGTWRGSRAV